MAKKKTKRKTPININNTGNLRLSNTKHTKNLFKDIIRVSGEKLNTHPKI